VKLGTAEPVIVIVNVLSLILPKLSVALTVNVLLVSSMINSGVPLNKPVVEFKDMLLGSVPANNVYVTLVAGVTADADNVNAIIYPYGYDPIDPAGVFQFGCAILTI